MPMAGYMPQWGQTGMQTHFHSEVWNFQDPSRWVEHQRQELLRAEHAAKTAAAESGAFVGVVSRISGGVAFVECSETRLGSDAQIGAGLLPSNLEVGDTVVFRLGAGAQVVFAKRLAELTQHRQRILEVEAPPPSPSTLESPQEYEGVISSFQPDKGFGFISCELSRQIYGSDVYIHRDQYMNLSVGDAVQFRVALNPKSMPVGRGVRKTRHEVQGTGTAVQGFGPVGASRDGEAGERESPKGRSRSRSISRSVSERQSGRRSSGPQDGVPKRSKSESRSPRSRRRRSRSDSRSRRSRTRYRR